MASSEEGKGINRRKSPSSVSCSVYIKESHPKPTLQDLTVTDESRPSIILGSLDALLVRSASTATPQPDPACRRRSYKYPPPPRTPRCPLWLPASPPPLNPSRPSWPPPPQLPSRLRRLPPPPPRCAAASSPSPGPPPVRLCSDPTTSARPPVAYRPVTSLSHRAGSIRAPGFGDLAVVRWRC